MTPYADAATSRTFCGRCSHPMHFRECGAYPESTGGPCQCRNDADTLPFDYGEAERPATAPPRKCRRHQWARGPTERVYDSMGFGHSVTQPTACVRCGAIRDETRARRGRQSRTYGNRAELSVARTYGGRKVGHAGGPVDVRGKEFSTQVKTHRRLPPLEWRKAFAGMAQSEGVPRLLLRFVLGQNGQGTDDYFVLPAKAWLDWVCRGG